MLCNCGCNFLFGEEKYIEFEVTSCKGEVPVISSSKWVLKDGDEELVSGDCKTDGSVRSVFLAPPKRGKLTLELTYTIPPETRKARVWVYVD